MMGSRRRFAQVSCLAIVVGLGCDEGGDGTATDSAGGGDADGAGSGTGDEPDPDLVDRLWTVDAVLDLGAYIFIPTPDPATLRFESDGAVQVFTGCNGGEGTYTREGSSVVFEQVGSTEEACPEEKVQTLESGVLRVVHHDGPVAYEIDEGRLVLKVEDGVGLRLMGE